MFFLTLFLLSKLKTTFAIANLANLLDQKPN